MPQYMKPAEYLAIALKRFYEVTDACYPLWHRRFSASKSGFGREVVIELTRGLVFRVRDPQSGQILAESVPGRLDVLQPPPRLPGD